MRLQAISAKLSWRNIHLTQLSIKEDETDQLLQHIKMHLDYDAQHNRTTLHLDEVCYTMRHNNKECKRSKQHQVLQRKVWLKTNVLPWEKTAKLSTRRCTSRTWLQLSHLSVSACLNAWKLHLSHSAADIRDWDCAAKWQPGNTGHRRHD